jgi:hypothetical protein
MIKITRVVLVSIIAIDTAPVVRAAKPPSFAKDVRPVLSRYCTECHNAKKLKGGLDLESYQSLKEGADSGPVVVPGKPNESLLVLLTERKKEPHMPPKKARQPSARDVAAFRTWVAAGARDDTGKVKVDIPSIKPRGPVQAAVTALAYRPDSKLLAAGGYNQVTLIDPVSGNVLGKLPGQQRKVTALTFSNDGKWLAVASGAAATAGEVRLYAVPSGGLPAASQSRVLAGHKDLVQDIAFSPDGSLLATCGYDRLIKLWDVATGKEVRTLKDHSDAVYSVTFSPDGKLLASGSADRAVKVWDVSTGRRLHTLAESTDWVYTIAWAQDGRHLAGAGVDKSIRIWEVSAEEAKLTRAVFAHQAPVTRLVYSKDGKTLYSLGEDRIVKSWDTGRLLERHVYAPQPETVLALALRPDQKQLALGRYDGAAVLLDEPTGKVTSEPLPIKPQPPQVTRFEPDSGRPGVTVRLTFHGKYLDQPVELSSSLSGVVGKVIEKGRTPASVAVDVSFPGNAPAGVYKLGLKSSFGRTAQLPFTIDLFPVAQESEPNDSPTTGQPVTLPVSIVGAVGRPGDVDYYRFEAKKGQAIGVQVLTAAVGSKLDPVLRLIDPAGNQIAQGRKGLLAYTCSKAGTYALGIRDRQYRGGAAMHYRLHAGNIPIITSVFPLGVQRGTEANIHLEGVHLGSTNSVHVKADGRAALGSQLPVHIAALSRAPLGDASVVVGEFPERVWGSTKVGMLPVPGTGNGRIRDLGAADTWRFPAKKGQRLILEVHARRLGSPLDSFIEILDAHGNPLPRATLRCVAKTYTTFRDHDSVGPGIRIESWSDLAINDYLLVGPELLRIRELPKNPDDDCQFDSVRGRRIGYLGTTPAHHSLGTPMYKVSIHPPGTQFPPNGLPVVTLYYRNDDGGPGFGKDSMLFFDPPADGEYQVRIGDSRGEGGPAYAYRLTVRPPRPDFAVSFSPTAPAVWQGGAVPVTVTADRSDGFEGAIELRLDNLPPGFSAPATSIPAGENRTTFALWADAGATVAPKQPPLKLVARAMIGGKEVVRQAQGSVPRTVALGYLVTTTAQSEVSVQPGRQVRLLVRVERRGGFKGRIPLEVRGLPHGVRVLDIGLNGILITERESSRVVVIYAEPWVKPTAHPFVVLARHEGKGTEHAARSVLLRVTPAK